MVNANYAYGAFTPFEGNDIQLVSLPNTGEILGSDYGTSERIITHTRVPGKSGEHEKTKSKATLRFSRAQTWGYTKTKQNKVFFLFLGKQALKSRRSD